MYVKRGKKIINTNSILKNIHILFCKNIFTFECIFYIIYKLRKDFFCSTIQILN